MDLMGCKDQKIYLAMSRGKVLTLNDKDEWVFVTPDKFSAKDLTNED